MGHFVKNIKIDFFFSYLMSIMNFIQNMNIDTVLYDNKRTLIKRENLDDRYIIHYKSNEHNYYLKAECP